MRFVERKAQNTGRSSKACRCGRTHLLLSPVRWKRLRGTGLRRRRYRRCMDMSWWPALGAVVLLALVAALVDGGAGSARCPASGRASERPDAPAGEDRGSGRAGARAAAGRDLVGRGAVRGRAGGEGPAVSGAGRAGRCGARREDHQQASRGAAGGDRAAAGRGGRCAGAGELPGDGRAAGGGGAGVPAAGGGGGPGGVGSARSRVHLADGSAALPPGCGTCGSRCAAADLGTTPPGRRAGRTAPAPPRREPARRTRVAPRRRGSTPRAGRAASRSPLPWSAAV